MQPQRFPTERSKVAFFISLLSGKALAWAQSLWDAAGPVVNAYAPFTAHFLEVFSAASGVLTTADQLLSLHQGDDTITDYSLCFRTLAASSGWNESALLGVYRQGLSPEIRQAMAVYDDKVGLEGFIQKSIGLSQRLAACSSTPPQPTPLLLTTPPGAQAAAGAEPMQISRATVGATRVEEATTATQVEIPEEYQAFKDVFCAKVATRLPLHWPWECCIDPLPGAKLPKGRVYPLSAPEHRAMEEYVQQALRQGFIAPSTSPAASSFFFVGKKDGGLCPCIDYRQLNSQIAFLPYPLPLVPAALEDLREARVFTKLDLRSAYNLVRIRKGDEWKTAFITPSGHYEYRVMPYGLSISPAVFQGFMNEVLRPYLQRFVMVYIDDILIYSRNLEEHHTHVRQVLGALRSHHLYLNLSKCEFHRPQTRFLGYVISFRGIQMDEGKVKAVWDWPIPETIKELQRFLGFANFYRRFIQGYSRIAAPLTSLLRGKARTLKWTPEAQEAFHELRRRFCDAPVLRHPDPRRPFVVEVDASSTGVGAALSQWSGSPPRLHPCAFYSHKLSVAEQNYDIGNRELLAIKLALEEWRHWLKGAELPLTVITDHKNLQYLREARRLNPRQARGLFSSPGPIVWEIDEEIRTASSQEPAPEGCPEGRVFVPTTCRWGLIQSVHGGLGTGHPGEKRTAQLVQARYWWPGMTRDINRFVQECASCAMAKVPRHLPVGKLMLLLIPQHPWSHLGIDFVTDLPRSEGNTCILVVVDRFSKGCHFIPLKGLPTALETAEALFHQVFRTFGLPEEIVLDRGPQFTFRVWKAFFRHLGVSVNLSSGYYPQSNSQAERKIQELSQYLRIYCSQDQGNWCRFLPWPEYAQNSLRQDTTGLTPFQCTLGFQPPLFPWSDEPSNVPAVDAWFRESNRVWESAHTQLRRALRNTRRHADARRLESTRFRPGDRVWLSTRDLRLKLPCRKLSPRFIGPFKVVQQINDVSYRLELPPRYRIHPTFHVSRLKPYVSPASRPPGDPAVPVQPEVVDQPEVYAGREVLDSRRRGGRLEYLVDWEGYGPEERSWVARQDVLDPALLEEFHAAHPCHLAPGAGLVAESGCPVSPLREGVVSGSTLRPRPHQPRLNGAARLITNALHLISINHTHI
ncbi:hypothetical protein C0J50_7543 [Silurus asotus]|uniref:Gypsy retrotransposon integrase-like protein 1 n=1 Tax=Silurus asotus TaxID=30991 RepID=A0AAD5F8R2_SILAS|nr:hypothetical protein C0J50_7543 [Silurus asotus]